MGDGILNHENTCSTQNNLFCPIQEQHIYINVTSYPVKLFRKHKKDLIYLGGMDDRMQEVIDVIKHPKRSISRENKVD